MYFFGGCAFILFLIALFSLIISFFAEFIYSFLALFITGWLFFGFAIITMLLGLIAEVLMRTYYESTDKRVYNIKEIL